MTQEKLKTTKNNSSVAAFVKTIKDKTKQSDTKELIKLFKEITNEKPVMWGDSIIGFGEYEYERSNGEKLSFLRTGMSPRKANLALYVLPGYSDSSDLLSRLGPHRLGKSCLYIKSLEKIDMMVLKIIIQKGYREMSEKYPEEDLEA